MKETDIRSQETLNRYLELVRLDCGKYFNEPDKFLAIDCPACGFKKYTAQFIKNNFPYVTCNECGTLYVNKRPALDKFKQFYADSESTSYWVNSFFKPFIEARRQKIFIPRAQYFTEKYGKDPQWMIGDIGAGFGLFLQELKKLWGKSRFIAIEPSLEQAKICRGLGLEVENSMMEELSGYDTQFDLLTAFELFEHLYDPQYFLRGVHKLLKPGARFLMTTLNGEGLDIQLLWEKAKPVTPPHHLNFFNPASLTRLLEKNGFKIEELSTPGKLDWSITESMILNEGADCGRFWNMLARKGSSAAKEGLQEWLVKNNLSSHMRVVAVKV